MYSAALPQFDIHIAQISLFFFLLDCIVMFLCKTVRLWHDIQTTCLAFSYFYKVQWSSCFLLSNRLSTPNPRTYIGSGKVSEIRSAIQALDVETVIFDDELSPG